MSRFCSKILQIYFLDKYERLGYRGIACKSLIISHLRGPPLPPRNSLVVKDLRGGLATNV